MAEISCLLYCSSTACAPTCRVGTFLLLVTTKNSPFSKRFEFLEFLDYVTLSSEAVQRSKALQIDGQVEGFGG